jgi:putative hydrolase
VILELNDHSFAPTSSRSNGNEREREFARAAYEAGARIAIGSDAHYALGVGRFDAALAVAEEIGIAEERIVNRTAASVLEFLLGKRERPRLDVGGTWEWPENAAASAPRGEIR